MFGAFAQEIQPQALDEAERQKWETLASDHVLGLEEIVGMVN
jgi:hypothetical protein